MKVMKRNGTEVAFDKTKIENAIRKANASVSPADQLPEYGIQKIALGIEGKYATSSTPPTVEQIQDDVIERIMEAGAHKLAHSYTVYRYEHELMRKANTTDARVLSIVDGINADAKTENANKNPTVISTQRDYIAGEVSRDIASRKLLPAEVVDAHNQGIIHFHDMDYFICHSINCNLVNLDDMLQNGTVISGTLIEKPHRFSTACNIATQAIAQISSMNYGGQTMSLTHLAKFVDVSRQAIRKEVLAENADADVEMSEEQVEKVVERRLRKEIRSGIQTIQYQVLTLLTTNGQAPFVTLWMYLNEAGDDEQLKADLAMCIEEVLLQRIEGVKNEVGQWITPSFPKLVYVLQEDNITPGSKYYPLTELAAKCTAKRLVPDYVSEKIMMKLKVDEKGNGNVYPPMGCTTAHVKPDERKQERCAA